MLVDLKRTPKDKKEEAAEYAPTAASQPDYGYGLCIHLEDAELAKLGIKDNPKVGDEYHLRVVAYVKGVNERDYGERQERCVDLQITAMEVVAAEDASEEGTESAADEDAEERGAVSVMHSMYSKGR